MNYKYKEIQERLNVVPVSVESIVPEYRDSTILYNSDVALDSPYDETGKVKYTINGAAVNDPHCKYGRILNDVDYLFGTGRYRLLFDVSFKADDVISINGIQFKKVRYPIDKMDENPLKNIEPRPFVRIAFCTNDNSKDFKFRLTGKLKSKSGVKPDFDFSIESGNIVELNL